MEGDGFQEHACGRFVFFFHTGQLKIISRPSLRLNVVCDSLRRPIAGVGRVTLTLLRELARLGHDITPVDLFANRDAEKHSKPTLTLQPRLPWGRTALWHLDLLNRIPRMDVDFLLDPTGYPDALGHHPNLIFWVHDLHMLEKGFYRPGKRLWFRTFLRRGLQKARLIVCVSNHTRLKKNAWSYIMRWMMPCTEMRYRRPIP